jgi:hypothetical protein
VERDEDGVEVSSEWYAQLRLLFNWGGLQLAAVRYLQRDSPKATDTDTLVQHGAVRLKWEKRGYEIIPLESIIRRVYVVPAFQNLQVSELQVGSAYTIMANAKRLYDISSFKWDSMGPDYRTFEQRLADQQALW